MTKLPPANRTGDHSRSVNLLTPNWNCEPTGLGIKTQRRRGLSYSFSDRSSSRTITLHTPILKLTCKTEDTPTTCEKMHPDIILAYTPRAGWPSGLLCGRRLGVEYFLFLHCVYGPNCDNLWFWGHIYFAKRFLFFLQKNLRWSRLLGI